MKDITEIGVYLIGLLAALVEVFLIPYLKQKIDIEKLKKIIEYVKIAVQAAEQILGEGKGKEKKQYVVNYLKSKNITVDEATLDAAIESAVLEMNNELLK